MKILVNFGGYGPVADFSAEHVKMMIMMSTALRLLLHEKIGKKKSGKKLGVSKWRLGWL